MCGCLISYWYLIHYISQINTFPLVSHCNVLLSLFANCRYSVDGEQKYLAEVQELIRPERNTLSVSFEDVEKYNQQLATTILEEYYR